VAQQATPPQPGAGADVHTGTSSGLDTDARLRNLLADHQFSRVEAQLDQLPPEQAQFYRGILANRSNDLKTSIQLLEPLVDQVAASGDKAREKLLRKALAEDYLRLGDWGKANQAFATLESKLSPEELDEMELPLKLLPLAATEPAMTVEACDPFVFQVSRNPLGLIDIPVFVDARPHSWMLDPTAPFNLIARSVAKETGLKVSLTSTTIHTLTGRPMVVHVTVIPRFTLGGRITFRNMTAFVFEDGDYSFAKKDYRVQGVLGYPAVSALASLTITADETVEVRPLKTPAAINDDANESPAQGARFYFDGDQMIVGLGKKDEERMYAIDASGQQTYLTSRYFDEHAGEFSGQRMALFNIPGAETRPPQPAYTLETVALAVGEGKVEVHDIQVLTQPLGSAAFDDVYGVLGVDALDQLRAYTFDFKKMRLTVRARE
jgi:hypothetical protein